MLTNIKFLALRPGGFRDKKERGRNIGLGKS
jgi:hypothetical protein